MTRLWTRAALISAAAVLPAAATSLATPGCGSTTVDSDAGGGGSGTDASTDIPPDAEPVVTVLHPKVDPLPGETECTVTITTGIPVTSANHVAACTHVDYSTNPPSGGDHWGSPWASYLTYDVAVPREMYVHSMEHGAVVLLYKCDGACPDVLEAFAEGRKAVQGDPKCLMIPGGPTERVVITPDPDLDVPVAAAAWGATYKATCLDTVSLRDFVKKSYDKASESLCAGSGPIPTCTDAGADSGSDADSGTGGSGGAGGAGGSGGTGAAGGAGAAGGTGGTGGG